MRTVALAAALWLLSSVAAGAPSPPPPAAAVLAELPFLDSDDPNQIWVDLAPQGGRAMRFMLDTGTPHSLATPGAARAMGVAVRRTKQRPYRRDTRLGRDVEFWVDTRHGERSARGAEWALLGGRFLAEYVLEIDFAARRVRFLDPDLFEVPERSDDPAAAVLPLRINGSIPVLEIGVGAETVSAVLATGASGTLVLPGEWHDRGGVHPDDEATAQLVLPPGAPSLYAAVVERLRIGPFEVTAVPLLVAPEGMPHSGFPGSALLGVDLLKHYALRIDYRRGRLWIRVQP